MALVVPVLAVLPLFAVPMVLATRAADNKRGQAEQRGTPRTRLAGHLFTLATTAAPGRETRLLGLAGELRRRYPEEWDCTGRDIARNLLITNIEKALGWSGPAGVGEFARGALPDPQLCARLMTPQRLLDLLMRGALGLPGVRCLRDDVDLHPNMYATWGRGARPRCRIARGDPAVSPVTGRGSGFSSRCGTQGGT